MGNLIDTHQNVVALHLHRERLHPLTHRKLRLATPQIERPRVPRTHHRVPLDPALPQRPLPVRTKIIQRQQLPSTPRQANRHPTRLGLHHIALRRRLSHPAQPHPLLHSIPPLHPNARHHQPSATLASVASPTPKRTAPPLRTSRPAADVRPAWLLKALALTLVAALSLAYLSVCALVYAGGWQRLLTPSPSVDKTPAAIPLPFDTIRFDASTTGHPRLTAWWIPAANPAAPTILFLHDGVGSLSNTLPTLALLHQANLNLFAFDYRGFGQSDPPHATEARMAEDASAALNYLLDTRHLPAATIIPYGQGLGAVLAANLTNAHPELPALIIDTPDVFAFDRVVAESRSRYLPMRLLLRDHFDITTALAASTRPKLLLVNSPFGDPSARTRENQTLFHTLPDPRLIVTFSPHSQTAYLQSVHRFLDEYVARPSGATP